MHTMIQGKVHLDVARCHGEPYYANGSEYILIEHVGTDPRVTVGVGTVSAEELGKILFQEEKS